VNKWWATPLIKRKNRKMSTFNSKDGMQIYYKDWGTGKPVVFSHDWPLSADAWESQMVHLAANGHRCIAHDRRGHGLPDTHKDALNADLLAFLNI
jgi:non-heme chloroperoxidase